MDRKEINDMQSFLDITVGEEPAELTQRLSTLSAYMSRSGKLLADAKREQDTATAKAFMDNFKDIQKMSPSLAQKYVQSVCAEQNYFVNQLDRINRACVHQSENLRTQISFMKLELEMGRKGY